MLLLTLLTTAFATSYTENFGTVQTVGCAAVWDGVCEAGWNASGPVDTLAMCNDGGEHYVTLDPSGSSVTGFQRVVALDSSDEIIEWSAKVFVETAGTLRMATDFLDDTGAVITTVVEDRALSVGPQRLTLIATAPNSTFSVRIRVGTHGPSLFHIAHLSLAGHLMPGGTIDLCGARATAVEDAERQECEDAGMFHIGECEGDFDPVFPLSCEITCDLLQCVPFPEIPTPVNWLPTC